MNLKHTSVAALIIIFVFSLCHVQAQNRFVLKSAKASIQGTSSLHDWESEITKTECTAFFTLDNRVIKAVKSAEIKVRVQDIKSEKGRMMDNKTYDAFLYEKHPLIVYTLLTAKVVSDNSAAFTIEANGNLTMAGTTKPVSLTANGKVLPNGDVQLSVSKKIKMTEFKMEQPTALMGTITVGDEVTVNFDLVLSQSSEQVNNK